MSGLVHAAGVQLTSPIRFVAPAAMLPREIAGVAAVRTGAVLAVTVSEAVSVMVLKAVALPLVLTSTLVPAVPLDASHAR